MGRPEKARARGGGGEAREGNGGGDSDGDGDGDGDEVVYVPGKIVLAISGRDMAGKPNTANMAKRKLRWAMNNANWLDWFATREFRVPCSPNFTSGELEDAVGRFMAVARARGAWNGDLEQVRLTDVATGEDVFAWSVSVST